MDTLLTGSTGFVGRHFTSEYSCVPMMQTSGDIVPLEDFSQVKNFITGKQFAYVVHLGGVAFVPFSFENPEETYKINFFGTFHLLKALEEAGFKGKFLFVGSADGYGMVPEQYLPVMENQKLRPRNPYAVSKVAAEALCYQWSQTSSFKVTMVRPFNHIGPGQSEDFVISNFAKQIIEIKLGKKEPRLQVGDIEVRRDFTDVRDVVKAYGLLLKHGENGEVYNICSGKDQKIAELLNMMVKISGIKPEIQRDPQRYRPSEQRTTYGSFEKISEITGWKPQIPLNETLTDILNYWEQKLNE